MPWLTRAMWLAPSVPDPHRYAGRCLAADRQGVFARREYRLAFMLGDGSALDEAVARFTGADELVQLVPETAEALAKLAELLERSGRGAEAAGVLERGWETLEDPDLLFRLGAVRVRAGDPTRAVEIARRLGEAEPDHPRSYVLASLALRGLGEADGALRELETGAARFPDSPEVALALGEELLHQRRFAQASQVLSRGAWRAGPHATRARDLLVSALRAQGRLAEAVAEARTARELDPRNVAVNLRLADVLEEAGFLDEATGVLSATLVLPGADPATIAARVERVRARAPTGGDRRAEGERAPR
jgi:tetratricopeptide (TPR) repeat protein